MVAEIEIRRQNVDMRTNFMFDLLVSHCLPNIKQMDARAIVKKISLPYAESFQSNYNELYYFYSQELRR